MKRLVIMTAIAVATASAAAADAWKIDKVVPLRDGATLYIFQDGKMAMEDAKGRIVRMKPGETMEGKDGAKYIMVGDEVMRLRLIREATLNLGG